MRPFIRIESAFTTLQHFQSLPLVWFASHYKCYKYHMCLEAVLFCSVEYQEDFGVFYNFHEKTWFLFLFRLKLKWNKLLHRIKAVPWNLKIFKCELWSFLFWIWCRWTKESVRLSGIYCYKVIIFFVCMKRWRTVWRIWKYKSAISLRQRMKFSLTLPLILIKFTVFLLISISQVHCRL